MHTTYSEKVFSSLTSIFTELGFCFIRKYYKVFQISKLCRETEKYVEHTYEHNAVSAYGLQQRIFRHRACSHIRKENT